MFRTRLLTALVGIPAVLAVAWAREPWLSALVAGASLLGALEAAALLERAGLHPHRAASVTATGLVAVALLLALNHAALGWAAPLTGDTVLLVGAFAVPAAVIGLAVVAVAVGGGDPPQALRTWMSATFVVVYLGTLVPAVAAVGHLSPAAGAADHLVGPLRMSGGTAWLLVLLAGVWACDTAAYLYGRSFGRRPLAPRVSPRKTVEGFAAGLLASTAAVGAASAWLVSVPLPAGLALGLLVGVVAPVGDLAKSLLKRAAGVKDSGSLFPGHGGILDRMDSLLFAAPVVLAFALLVTGARL